MIGFAGTAPFGADLLERLAPDHEIAWVLTRPDSRQGRGRRLAPPPVKVTAESLGLEVRQAERLSEFDVDVETVVVAAYGRLVPTALLERARWLNVHPSLLPRWRGAAPVERAIMAGDTETGVTIIELVEELDAGPVVGQRSFPIEPGDDAGAVFAKAAPVAVELLDDLHEPRPQPRKGVTYAEKIAAADRELEWSGPAEELERRVRALSPHIGALAELHGRRVIVWRAAVVDGTLEPVEVQPEGRRRMPYADFLRGLR